MAAGGQQQVAEFARRTFAAARGGHVAGDGAHLGMGIGRRGREGDARQHRQVRPVVADRGGLRPVEAQFASACASAAGSLSSVP